MDVSPGVNRNRTDDLRRAYDSLADERSARPRRAYREEVLFGYRDLLIAEGRTDRMIEVGAGAGQDALVFHEAGIGILATDLAPNHVEHCRRRGLEAMVASFFDLPFDDGSFRAGLAMSTFLHVSDEDIDRALSEVARVLEPGAPLGVGSWSGTEHEGEWIEKEEPRRFFAIRSDEAIQEVLGQHFTVEGFETMTTDDPTIHYQWTMVRR